MRKTRPAIQKAFSLVEVAMVLLIVGLIIAGTVQGARIMKKARLTSARAATSSSPINFTKGLKLWYDSAANTAISENEAIDGGRVSLWNNIAQTISASGTSSGNNRPTYVDGITGLPQLSFSGSNFITLPNSSFPSANSPYTIFAVVNVAGAGTLLNSGSGSDVNSISFNSSGDLTVNGGTDKGGSFSVTTNGINTMQIVAIAYDGTISNTTSNKVWVNSVSRDITTVTSGGAERNTGATPVTIGSASSGFNGRVGEIIAFNRNLSTSERQDVEKYLSKKWSVRLTSSLSSGNGSIICTVAAPGSAYSPSGSRSVVAGGTNPYTCASGYVGTPTYNCTVNGSTISVSGCTLNTCAALTAPSNGTISITGGRNPGQSGDTATLNCAPNYEVSGTGSTLCSNGTWDPTSLGSCALITCTTTEPGAGYSPNTSQTVTINGANPYTCAVGYRGAPTYSCTTNGSTISVSGCIPDVCPALTAPSPSSIGSISIDGTGTRKPGEIATLSCNIINSTTAYMISGNSSATCKSDVTWDQQIGTCTPTLCPFSSVSNGTLSFTNGNGQSVTRTGNGQYGDTMTLTCSTGPTNYYNAGNDTATCQQNGTWSRSVGPCSRSCYQYTVNGGQSFTPSRSINSSGLGLEGDALTVACITNHARTGNRNLVPICQSNSTWSPSPQTCNLSCSSIAAPANGSISIVDASGNDHTVGGNPVIGDTATISCNTGYLRSSNTYTSTCTQTTGAYTTYWNPSLSVTCAAKGCYSTTSTSSTLPTPIDSGTGASKYKTFIFTYNTGNPYTGSAYTFYCNFSTTAEVLVVGGGGGGGGNAGGGGGGGGYTYNNNISITNGTNYPIIVGLGGSSSGNSSYGNPGIWSRFGTMLSAGGGGGGSLNSVNGGNQNSNGGSYTNGSGGGAGSFSSSGTPGAGGGNGNSGGNTCRINADYRCGGGGGGIGSVGGNASCASVSSLVGGNGGNGIENSISGSSKYYSCGGVGAPSQSNGSYGVPASPPSGYSGSSCTNNAGRLGSLSGAAGTGAGGAGVINGVGGSGGHGTVIIKVACPDCP